MSTIPNPSKSRTWDLGTSANGTFFDTEFNQLYANDNDLDARVQALEARVVTSDVAYTPSTQGLGTLAASNVRSHRDGQYLVVSGVITLGTPTGDEARINLGYNGTDGNVTSVSTYGTLEVCGFGASTNGNEATFYMLIEASKAYMTIGFVYTGHRGLSKSTGSNAFLSGQFSFNARVKITGW